MASDPSTGHMLTAFRSPYGVILQQHGRLRRTATICLALLSMLVATGVNSAHAMETVTFVVEGKTRTETGRVLVESQDGGVLLQAQDGKIWAVTSQQLQSRSADEMPFAFLTADELGKKLLEELPGFQVYTTAHYVICYNTSKAYAQWSGALFERLQRAFLNYWRRQGLTLEDPPPLVALVFQNRSSYEAYGHPEVGDAIKSIIGYYSMHTNRIAMYDLTGSQDARPASTPWTSVQVNQLLALPAAEHTVATIIHEATHQLAYNCGMQARYADIPMWVNEGLAIYFETPDLGSGRGWRTMGALNRYRLRHFHEYLEQRSEDSLVSLILDDQRFRSDQQAEAAYAEAWAFCYFLIRTRGEKFVEYLRLLAERTPLDASTPEERLTEFRSVFGEDLQKLDVEFLRHMRRYR